MKKVLLFLFLFIPSFVLAKEITYCERTFDDLKIDESIDINTVNTYDVMITPCVDESVKVYDFANILSDSEEESLYTSIASFIEAYKSDYVIVTIEENNYCVYEEGNNCTLSYADNFYKYNKFNKDGILLLVDLKNKNDILQIYTYGNTSSIFDLKAINSIKSYSYKYFNTNDYNEGFKDIIYTMSSYYNKDLTFYNEPKVTTVKETNKYFIFFVISFLISFVSGIIFMSFNYNKSKSKKILSKDNIYVKNNGINKVNDLLVSENEIITKLDQFDDYNIEGDIL